MFDENKVWRKVQNYLPCDFRIDEETQPNEKWTRYEDVELRYDEYIPKKSTRDVTVFIFHGVGGNGRLLSFLAVPLVKAGYKVICPDLPGYGYTKIKRRFNYYTWTACCKFLVSNKQFTSKKNYVIGLSAGGMLAYNTAGISDNIDGIIVTNLLDNRIQEVKEYSARNKFQANTGLTILNLLPDIFTRIKVPIRFITNMKALVNDKNILRLLLKDKVGAGGSVPLRLLISMMSHSVLVEPEHFKKCSVLLVHPENDKWTPFHLSKYFFDRLIVKKKFVLLEKAGHFPIEQPGIDQLKTEIINFIENDINI